MALRAKVHPLPSPMPILGPACGDMFPRAHWEPAWDRSRPSPSQSIKPIENFDNFNLMIEIAGSRLSAIILTRFLAAVKMSPAVACARVGGVFL